MALAETADLGQAYDALKESDKSSLNGMQDASECPRECGAFTSDEKTAFRDDS